MDIEMNSIGTTNNSQKHSVNLFTCPKEGDLYVKKMDNKAYNEK